MTTMLRRSALALTAPLLMGLALSPAAGCSAADGSDGFGEDVETHGMSFEDFKATVYQEPGSGVYIVNGDTTLETLRELEDFYLQNVQKDALIIHQSGGVDAKWNDTQKINISYCVSKTFNGNYDRVVQEMASATGAWEQAANVNFVHLVDQDGNCAANNANVVFDVRPTSGQPYLARAFFPNQGRSSRNVLIDSSSFGSTGKVTLTGILRHELGHTLGFRHEHTRSEAGTCFEDNSFRPLTPYDSKSVMHYPQCNGANQGDLVLTDKDKQGAAGLYGAPGANPEPPANPGGACTHVKCATGEKLTASCDTCVAKVCAADSWCCNNTWDAQCVSEVKTVCNESCSSTPVSCAHPTCTAGTKLNAACDPCAQKVCAADSYCCNDAWDGQCVQEVNTICKQTCTQ